MLIVFVFKIVVIFIEIAENFQRFFLNFLNIEWKQKSTWSELESSPVAALSEVGGRIFFFLFGGNTGDSS